MQLGTFARWLKRDSRALWEGPMFNVASEGRGRNVLLLHGLAASPDCWSQAREALGSDVRLHFVHMRGFAGLAAGQYRNGSFLTRMAEGVADYIRREMDGPAAIVGHSMGGIVALIAGRDHRDAVGRLLVADVPSFFSVLITPFATAASVAGLAELARRRYLEKDEAGLEDELRRTVRKLVTAESAVERLVRWGLQSDQKTTADVMAEVMTTDLRPDLPCIRAPVDIVYGWDKTTPMTRTGLDQLYASAYSGLPDQRRLRIDAARHYIMLDQPDAFYAAVRSWLDR